MSSLVVKDRNTAVEWYNKGVASWSLDQMIPFQVQETPTRRSGASGGTRRRRNQTELEDGELPLPALKDVKGAPRYLVNLIKLRPNDEYLRDTVFWSIFRDSLLFDTIEAASEYRSKLIRNNRRPPQCVSVSGDILAADGLMDPKSKLNTARALKFEFGEIPGTEMKDYITAKEDIISIDKAVGFLDKLDELQCAMDELDEKDNSMEKLRNKVKDLKRKLSSITR